MEDDKMIEFLVAYKAFARGVTMHGLEQGLHNPYRFSPAYGLCAALSNFVEREVDDSMESYVILRRAMSNQLRGAIVRLVGDVSYNYPFGGEVAYIEHGYDRSQHENPERLKFVDNYLSELYNTNIRGN